MSSAKFACGEQESDGKCMFKWDRTAVAVAVAFGSAVRQLIWTSTLQRPFGLLQEAMSCISVLCCLKAKVTNSRLPTDVNSQ